jgi:Transposase.
MDSETKLSTMKLAAEIENHLHKEANPETVWRVLRQNDFHGRVARK